MRTLVLLDAKRLQRWHVWLISGLASGAAADGTLCVRLAEIRTPPRPAALRLLLEAERRLEGGRPAASDPITVDDLAHPVDRGEAQAGAFDLAFDLTGVGSVPSTAASIIVQPTFDGVLSEQALWAALLARRAPLIGIEVGATAPRPVARPAIAQPTRLRESADQVLSRLVEVLLAFARGAVANLPLAPGASLHRAPSAPALTLGAAAFAWRAVDAKAERALSRLLGTRERWRVGWRLAPQGRSHLDGLASAISYRMLGDDGARYFADPFVLFHEGVHHVFVEELPTATGRGLISHFTISEDSRASAPRPVLEGPHHLSYPQVFVHEGVIYMMPECAASGALDLYRADPFPHRWVPACRLLDAEVHDATLVANDSRFYLLAATRAFASTSWDGLCVYSADRLEGPWQPLPGNPVLLDAGASRPAGALYRMDGALWRPAQDCREGYGAALALTEVTRLDRDGFAQEVASTLRMPGRPDGHGPHTINWAAGLEVIDFLA